MNTKEISWAPANPWFKPGFDKKEEILIEGIKIQILPLAYFLASKFTAYEIEVKMSLEPVTISKILPMF